MGSLKPNTKYIYESPDGGKTIYAREFGSYERKLIGAEYPISRKINWQDIELEAKSNPALQTAIDRVILVYTLSKEKYE